MSDPTTPQTPVTVPGDGTLVRADHDPEVGQVAAIEPLGAPLDAEVRPPGSKSLTNRALLAAALATGESTLRGTLDADDTHAMIAAVTALGAEVRRSGDTLEVTGVGGRWRDGATTVDARLSGTTSRFVLASLVLAKGPVTLDGAPPLRARPMADGLAALVALGADVRPLGPDGHLPVEVRGAPPSSDGDAPVIDVSAATSSQFLSGLCLAAPCLPHGLSVRVAGRLVSRPYVAMTLDVLAAFGASATWEQPAAGSSPDTVETVAVRGGGYRGCTYEVEADASAASYFLAAAAICGGRVRVQGLGRRSTQGDVRFAEILEQMGVDVRWADDHVEVQRGGRLEGVRVDMADISDTAQTLAVVAPFASTPTEVRGIGFIRHKETNRIDDVVTELRRCGIEASSTADGFVIEPGHPQPATVRTYDDHRMAMSFALLGLAAPGIRIADPGCVAKTYPGYWVALEALAHGGAPSHRTGEAR
ncbi:MAG: 3-phosphoshikimate 1-carboxyvinyltransferase [Acidimicrobiia bacterium]|nr:3-phosphoshikimate 1-carboxyvinyltransferase [Acidimicrobiia bacterium]